MLEVVKRNGKREAYQVEKIHKVLEWATKGIQNVSISDIEMNAKLSIYDGIPTTKIHQVLVKSAADLISEDTSAYQYVAANLLNLHLRKEVWGSGDTPPRLYDLITKLIDNGIYDPEILNMYTEEEIHKLGTYINHDRDFKFTYAGIQQLIDKYLARNKSTDKIYETPQFAYMLVAMVAFGKETEGKLKMVREAYNHFSLHRINLPTPIMAGLRLTKKGAASCYLVDIGDSLDSIFSSIESVAKLTASRGGIGANVGRIRPIGSPIRGGDVIHTGVIPFLKVLESTVKSTSQNSLRGGGGTVSFPIWHPEIEDVIVLKNNAGTDDNRVRKLDYCIQLSRIFYERIQKNQDITLLSPHECPGLYEAFGDNEKFDELYKKYEQDETLQFRRKINGRKLIGLLLRERLETGRIYIMNIDHCYDAGPWKVIPKMTNLCVSGDATVSILVNGVDHKIKLKEVHDFVKKGYRVEILSYNHHEKRKEYKPVLRSYLTSRSSSVVTVKDIASGFNVEVTPDHEIATKNGYVEARNLRGSDQLITSKGYSSRGIIVTDGGNRKEVYDIEVEDNNNFFANDILVHNCVEIIQPTIPMNSINDENATTGVCILSAINLLEVESEEKMESVCRIIVRMLDNIIDYQSYPVKSAENFAKWYRSLGVGVSNLAALLAKNKLRYESQEALELVDEISEKIQYYLLRASCDLAKERKYCPKFKDTKYADGLLPINWMNKNAKKLVNRKPSMPWKELREDIKTFGLRNTTVTAQMPVESSSVIQNSTNGIEPIRRTVIYKSSKKGMLKMVVPGAYNLKNYYTKAFEIKGNSHMNKMVAVLQKYMDMSISANHYYNYDHYEDGDIPLSVIMKDIFEAYSLGVKTLYYSNTPDGSEDSTVACEGDACTI